jgi:type II secretory ATPase GspE/PulE/Tfp pilus assembly ATPase PilB-like protein
VPCPRCDAQVWLALLENALELLCGGCGRNVSLERVRALEARDGAEALAAELVALGVLTAEEARQATSQAREDGLSTFLLDQGLLRRDLRLTLELEPAEGRHAYTVRPLKEIVLAAEVEAALRTRRERGGVLADLLRVLVLERLGASLRSVGRESGLESLGAGTSPDPGVRDALPARAMEIYRALPLRAEGEALVVALWDPLDFQALADLEALADRPVHGVLADPAALAGALSDLGVASGASDLGALEGGAQAALDLEPGEDPFWAVLMEALEEGASEVHVEPLPAGAALRYRVRGELRRERALPAEAPGLLLERLSALSGSAGDERVQVGRVRCEVSGLPLTLEYRALETPLGPAVAMELEESGGAAEDASGLAGLGLGLEALAAFEGRFAQRRGMVVIAGSGAPGPYRALLARAARLGGSVLSLEARPGPPLPGVTQVDAAGLPAGSLRRLERPRPDWLGLSGPMQPEALALAADLALRGTGVIITVRAPDAASALLRLELAGIPRSVLEASVGLVLARRVLDRLCPHCRVERDASLGWVGLGCAACADLGTRGRLFVAEALQPRPGGVLTPLPGSARLAERARSLLRAGEVTLQAVSDLLEGAGTPPA